MQIYKLKKCFQKSRTRYMNKHMIDDYIDNYWIFNCPDNYSVQKINDQVYNFFHQLFLINSVEICKN
jgi:hypothetical protein